MTSNSKKVLVAVAVLAVTAFGFSTSASARLPNQVSLGGGVKCFAVPVVQADGSTVYTQICRRGP